jgi:actin-like ATPase involved in cell morphogenesis
MVILVVLGEKPGRIIALDIGSSFTKCVEGEKKIIFPSIYVYRRPTIWEDKNRIIEAVGVRAIAEARHPNSIKLYPIVDGKPLDVAYVKLAKEALHRLGARGSSTCVVTGVPYETGKEMAEQLKQRFKSELGLEEVVVYAQGLGTLFDVGVESGIIINVGHGTTEILVVERFNMLAGMSEPLASDYVLQTVAEYVQRKYGFKPSIEDTIHLVAGNVKSVSAFGRQEVTPRDIEEPLQESVSELARKICYDAKYLLTQVPGNMECTRRIILSGGGSLIKGVRESIQQGLGMKVVVPKDPIFSNAQGFYKRGERLWKKFLSSQSV